MKEEEIFLCALPLSMKDNLAIWNVANRTGSDICGECLISFTLLLTNCLSNYPSKGGFGNYLVSELMNFNSINSDT